MATGIRYLFPINLTKNELQNAVIQNLAQAPASPKVGQIYFDTAEQQLFIGKQDNGSVEWKEVGVLYDLSVVQSNGDVLLRLTGNDDTESDIKFTGTGAATVTRTDAGTIDIEVPTTLSTEESLTLTFDGGTTLGTDKYEFDGSDAVAIDFVGGTDIDLDASAAEITINHADVTRTDTTSNSSPAFAGTFEVVDGITTSNTGHVTAVNVKTVTVPTETTLSIIEGTSSTGVFVDEIEVDDHEITVTRSNSTENTVTVGELVVSDFGDGNGNVTIAGNLTVNGTTTTLNTNEVTIEDNIIQINSNQEGTPTSSLVSGLEVNRGDETNFQFVFVEQTDDFRLGKIGALQPALTRDEVANLSNNDLLVWDSTGKRAVGTKPETIGIARKVAFTLDELESEDTVEVIHNLGTQDLTYSIRAGNEFVYANVEIIDNNKLEVSFGEIGAITEVRITIIG